MSVFIALNELVLLHQNVAEEGLEFLDNGESNLGTKNRDKRINKQFKKSGIDINL